MEQFIPALIIATGFVVVWLAWRVLDAADR